MRQFRTKKVKVTLDCFCVETSFFRKNFLDYYEYLGSSLCESKVHGYYFKEFFKRKSTLQCEALGIDPQVLDDLPRFVCVSPYY